MRHVLDPAANPPALAARIWGGMATDLSFDLDRYLRVSGASKPAAFDWERPQPPLSDQALFCLAYMMDIESHTIVYLRELLSTAIVREVDVTAFLSCWAYEEFFHSLLLRRFLGRQGVEIDDRRFSELRRRRSLADQMIVPIARLVSRVTRHFPAVHMTWGAINEFSTLTGYQAVIRQTDPGAAGSEPSLLTTILERIIKDERRHFAFYFNQAQVRLRPLAAQRLTSFLLRRFWTPVGVTVRGDESMRRVCAFMFPDDAGLGALGKLDSKIRTLPGLDWFNLGRRYAEGNCSGCFERISEEEAGRGGSPLQPAPLGQNEALAHLAHAASLPQFSLAPTNCRVGATLQLMDRAHL